MTEEKALHFYLYLCRPPGIGCQPPGFDIDTREAFYPAKKLGNTHCFGRCGWPRRLTAEEVWRYDLRPESDLERAENLFEREAPDWIRDDYLSQTEDFLEEHADRDITAWAALVIKRAQAGT